MLARFSKLLSQRLMTGFRAARTRQGGHARYSAAQSAHVAPTGGASCRENLSKLRSWWWWGADARAKFKRRVRRASPYIVILLLPGSFIILPLYALWREKRRARQVPALPQLPQQD